MKIATWNVNSLRARHDLVLAWVRRVQPTVLCLQETKVVDDDFPTDEFQRLGYSVVMAGQRTYNGVAIVTNQPLKDVRIGLEGARPEDDKRLVAVTVADVRVYSAYVPNGKSVEHPDFAFKLRWLRALRATVAADRQLAREVALCGDFNIARDDRDVFDPDAMRGHLHFHPQEHEVLAELLDLGLTDAFRLHNDGPGEYSWWDYRAGAFRRNQGLRIDYVFVSPGLAQRCRRVEMDKLERKKLKPSDHCPVVAEFD